MRGKHYSARRAWLERVLGRAYAGDWPARVWALVPRATRVVAVRHRFALLPGAGRAPLRIAFASDLHLGPTSSAATLDAAFELVASFDPHVALLGGDYVFLSATAARTDELCRRVSDLRVPTKLAVLGNHDLWTDHVAIERALERGGARVLVNESVCLPAPFDDVAIVGLDEPWTGAPDAAAALAGTRRAGLRVGLCHSPDGAHFLRDDVSLLLAGHTHGGQIALPGAWPIVLPPGPYSKRYPYGAHGIGAMQLVVSRGVGTTELPIRMFAPADVLLVELICPT
jgi:predicted MPP superfamily phosphohydrolase